MREKCMNTGDFSDFYYFENVRRRLSEGSHVVQPKCRVRLVSLYVVCLALPCDNRWAIFMLTEGHKAHTVCVILVNRIPVLSSILHFIRHGRASCARQLASIKNGCRLWSFHAGTPNNCACSVCRWPGFQNPLRANFGQLVRAVKPFICSTPE